MIFKEIHLDGFGIFNSFSLTNLRQGVNIILGNNEVGKSTLLKFLRYTLFGYPRAIDQRMPPIKGGKHGGRIKAILSSQKEVIFERFAGGKGGTINLLFDGKSSENQSYWFQLLDNATSELYNNVYAFSLHELVDLGSLSTSGVEDKIFSVGLGLGNTSISDVEYNIQSHIDRIYTQRGSKQKIPSILKEIQSNKSQIKEIQNNLPKYQELTQEIQQLESEITDNENQLKKFRTKKDKLDNYLKCYDSFVSIVNIDAELETLPKLQEYPEDGVEELKELEREERELYDKIQELQKGSEDEKGIEELEEDTNSISFNSELLTHGDKVEYLRKTLEKYKQTITDKTEDDGKIEKLNIAINQGLNKISSKWTAQNVTEFADLISHKNKIEDFKKKFEDIESNKRVLEAEQKALQAKESLLNTRSVTIAVSLIFLIASIPAFYYSLHFLGAAILVIALILFVGRKFFIKESSLRNIQQQLSEWNDKEENVKNNYEDYLEKKLILEKSLAIESVLEIFRTIEQIKIEINERDGVRRKQEEQRIPFIQKFGKEESSLREILDVQVSADNMEVVVNQIINEFDKAQGQSQERIELQNSLTRKQRGLERTESKFKKNQEQLKNLIESIYAKDCEDFRKKYEDNNKIKELIRDRKNAVETIEMITGLDKSDQVIDFLNNNDKDYIENEVKNLESEISDKEEEEKIRNNEFGEKKNELKRIEGESELAEVMTELETEIHRLHNAYKDWLAGKIALKSLTDAKEKYEIEKQPEVIKNSSIYFRKITGERYKRISASLDERDVAIFDSKEANKKIGQLSRGTKEQLLVSLRLGFIEEYEKRAEPLPIIIDEVLVNFDPHRARQTAEILHEFGKDRQILIFTCHPETKDYFDNSTINLIQI
jgi:uncharacterized protein YhaN